MNQPRPAIPEEEHEAARVLEFLASSPVHGHTTCRPTVLRVLLLHSDGQVMAQGHLWEIRTRNLGAGIYDVSLEDAR